MDQLWGLVNSLQIIHFIPMMSLFFPAHARVMFDYISIANADNVPLATAFGWLYTPDDLAIDDYPYTFRFER